MHTAPGGVAERLAEMVPALLEQLDEMTDRMVEILVETEPPYREAMAAGDPRLRTTLRRNLEVGIRGLLPDVPAAYYASHADGARAVGRLLMRRDHCLEELARSLDVLTQPMALVPVEILERLDLPSGSVDQRGDGRGARAGRGELGRVEVEVEAEHAPVLEPHARELSQQVL